MVEHTNSEIIAAAKADFADAKEDRNDAVQWFDNYAEALLHIAESHLPSDDIRNAVIEECAAALEADAKLCDCSAHSESECACGAWDDYKTITSQRAVEIVRALAKPC